MPDPAQEPRHWPFGGATIEDSTIEAIKGVVSIPVMLTGGVIEPEEAETLLAEGKADLIGVGRAILKDSEWARRAVAELGA
jgi:2,4-dienoyl-CoA reductase-like NADH-dependent reductase (Old Yellow Enzyme family)